jgi:HlyD family secretion protein
MTMSKLSRNNMGATSRIAIIVIAVAVVLAVVFALGGVPGRAAIDRGDQTLATVRRGPLTISVSEAGTIAAREQVILKSEVEGNTTIIYLMPEGTAVKKGTLLVELDASKLEDSKIDQEIRVQNAEASHIRAFENLAVVKSQSKSDIARAELDYRFAKEDLDQYLEGEYPKQLMDAKSNITLATEDVKLAGNTVEWSQRLFKEQYISKNELDKDLLARTRAEQKLKLAEADLRLLEEYTYKRQVAEFESEIDQTEMAQERVTSKARADEIQAKADLNAKESEYGQQQNKLKKIDTQIVKAKIYAPIDGMVVFATSAQAAGWRGSAEPLDEGQAVRERQELIHLPTADSKMAEVKIHESSLDKVALGMAVRVTVDAMPGKVYWGEVARIAPLPDAQSRFMNPDLKVFSTHIHLDGTGEGLRTGMSCRAEIIVKEFDDAVYVPVQSVMRVDDVATVWLAQGKRITRQPVEIGMANNEWVRVVSGLEANQKVLMSPPLAETVGKSQSSSDLKAPSSTRTTERGSRPTPPAKSAAPPAKSDTADAAKAQPTDADGEEATAGRRQWGGRGEGGEAGAGRGQGGGRGGWSNMTDEQRAAMRKRFENMTDEQREEMRKRFRSGGSSESQSE